MEQLLAHLNAIYPLNEALIRDLSIKLSVTELAKKDFLLRKGRVCAHVYFVQQGLLRCFYEKDDKVVCNWFMKEGDMIFSVKSFYTQTPALESIQALEDCVLYHVSYADLRYLYSTFIELNVIRAVLTEKYYLLCEERCYAMRMQRAYERYRYLQENHAALIQRVSGKYLASYLGVGEETLSRIRAGKKY